MIAIASGNPPPIFSYVFFRPQLARFPLVSRALWPSDAGAARGVAAHLARGENVLIASPTGTGKTFAAFLSVLDALAQEHARGKLR